jgi:hypothetical protein
MINQRWKPVVGWAARYGPIPVAAILLIAVWQDWMSWRDFGFIISTVVAISARWQAYRTDIEHPAQRSGGGA